MSRRRTASFVASAVLIAVSLSACTADANVESGDNQGFISGGGVAEVIPEADRHLAPEVTGTTLDGDHLSLSDYAGDVVVMNVWGSWCAPCRAEAPALQEVYKTNRSRGVQFIGINTRDQVAAAQAFEETFGVTYPSFDDQAGQLQLLFRETLPAEAIPSTVVIDREGKVAARVIGPTTYSQLSDLIDKVDSEK
jgi:thiol-disulfide isomerase/thioredoxin